MRIISLWQPWASLVAARLKLFETRSWSTAYRGTLLVHAAKRWGPDQRRILADWEARFAWGDVKLPREYPLGEIVAVAEIEDVLRTDRMYPDAMERIFGDWSHGRYAWSLGKIAPLQVKLPWVGRQGLWSPSDAEREVLQRHINLADCVNCIKDRSTEKGA